MARALLFDVGDVLVESTWVLLDEIERRTGRRVVGRGPLDPSGDPAWQRCLAGEIGVDEYWDQLATSAGFPDRIALWRAGSVELDGGVFAADALALVAEARAAGIKVGVLSNDLYKASTPEWVASRPEFQQFDALVDCTEFGERKPAPAPYLKAAADLGVPPEEIVFLDDTPYCIEGARAVGMIGVAVDPLARSHAFDRARRLLGLVPPTPADQLVAEFEGAIRDGDLHRLSALLHPDVVVWWNGVKVAQGFAAARRFFTTTHDLGHGRREGAEFQATSRAAEGDTVSVEWQSSAPGPGGAVVLSVAAELWTIRYGLLIEVRGYHHRLDATEVSL